MKNFVALKSEEVNLWSEEKKSISKTLKVLMPKSDGSSNYDGTTDDEVALMSKKFKQMMKKKGKF